ncbi:MAG: peptide ligase PGM1-related protein [Gemmatimonadaceae bacterium]
MSISSENRADDRTNAANTGQTPAPAPGSLDERCRFAELQRGLAGMFERVFPDPPAPRTIIAVPSMSLDRAELTKLVGAAHYEERLLCLLILLRLPAARIVYITSQPIATDVVDYYLRLLPNVSLADARQRLTMLSCEDDTAAALSEKILDRPELVERIRGCVTDPSSTHITCFNATALERTLAVRLGVPIYGCDPALSGFGTKSGSRDVFHRAGVTTPAGYEHLRGEDDMVRALAALKRAHPRTRRAVIKVEEGFSGEGNAEFSYEGAPKAGPLEPWVRAELPTRIRCVADDESWDSYREKFGRMGGIVEAFIDGASKRSPSVQCRVDPLGGTQIISTHDQVLGGVTGQIYVGCTFPARSSCCPGLHAAAQKVTDVLASEGIVGRFAIDFISTLTAAGWVHHAIEINVRKGGTTHPYLTMSLLTHGTYDVATGLYHSAAGRPCYYAASDNLCHAAYRTLAASSVIAAAAREGLHFDAAKERGVVFHMMGALGEHGKLGAVCIAPTRAGAGRLLERTVAMLDRESGRVATQLSNEAAVGVELLLEPRH